MNEIITEIGNHRKSFRMISFSQVLFLLALAVVSLTSFLVATYPTTKKEDANFAYMSIIRNQSDISLSSMIDAVTGKLFEMDKKRSYGGKRLKDMPVQSLYVNSKKEMLCDYWAVITSVNDPTVVVKQLAETSEKLCLVVVADKKSPTKYEVSRNHLVYLTVEDQEKLAYNIMKLVPWNHFARKNIGFLYAIQHGAKKIFDVDDDNELISTKNIIKQVFDHTKKDYDYIETKQYVTNPYMIYLNQKGEFIWPRGYPLEAIKTEHDYVFKPENVTLKNNHVVNLGVIQYLQNVNPDLDAIYRITHPIPAKFDDSITQCFILAKDSFAPWNAQSTLFNYNAFWGLLLPMTVHGRVSDIWRSYFTQRLLWEKSSNIAFCPSLVNHIRNQHRLIKDFDAELPLYTQAESLVKYLQQWKPVSKDIPSMLEELYIDMYERGILELKDVEFIQLWIQDLQRVGYSFEYIVC